MASSSPSQRTSLVALAIFAGLGLHLVESHPQASGPVWFPQMVAASDLARKNATFLASRSLTPTTTVESLPPGAPIGEFHSPITSSPGRLEAKIAAANPHFAAAMVDLLSRAGAAPGEPVAVAWTGSFPGLNVAVAAALQAMDLEAIPVTSVASSSWGANDPDWTWLDMERALLEGGHSTISSVAATMGAGLDRGRGLSAEGKTRITEAMARHGALDLTPASLQEGVRRRLELIESQAAGRPLAAYVNVGGGVASLGFEISGAGWPIGRLRGPAPDAKIPGVAAALAARGVEVIHLRNPLQLAKRLDLPPAEEPAGRSGLYRPRRPDQRLVGATLGLLSALLGVWAWSDRRGRRLTDPRETSKPIASPSPRVSWSFRKRPFRRWLTGFSILCAGLLAPVVEGNEKRSRGATGSQELRLSLEPGYDSNILRYSQRYIDRFNDGREPGRFRIESLDDTFLRFDLRWSRRNIGRHDGTFFLDLGHRSYNRNSIKDWSRLEVGWRQDLGSRSRLSLALAYLPEFYIRHQRDVDLPRGSGPEENFRPLQYSRISARAQIERPISPGWRGRVELEGAQLRYGTDFSELDSDDLRLGLRFDHRPTKTWRLTYRYRYLISSGRGADEPGEDRATSDDSDPTFRQHAVSFAARWRLRGKITDPTLRLAVEVFDRSYQTSRPAEQLPIYAGRNDQRLRVDLSYEWPTRRGLRLALRASWSQRRSESAISPLDLGAEKDFDVITVGVRLVFRHKYDV